MSRFTFALFLGVSFALSVSHASMEAVRECREQFKLTAPRVKADEASEDVKCFAECILKKTGCMDDKGNFVDGKIEEELTKMAKTEEEKASFQKSVSLCKKQVEASNPTGICEKGFVFLKCVRTDAHQT